MMPRRSDIEIAWYASIQQEPNGRKTVTTQRFVQELSKVSWNWTMKPPSAPPDKSGERERCQKMVMATIPHTQYLELSCTSLMMPGTRSLMTARLCE